jgi:23S rRNA pseudouridine955/2504/2580 synthase
MYKKEVSYVEISAQQANQRIDNFLITALKGLPKSRIYRLLRKGEVRVNKKRAKPILRLAIGDIVRIPPYESPDEDAPRISQDFSGRLKKLILYENDRLLVLNKDAGMAVHGGSSVEYGIITHVRAWGEEYAHCELVHRLDQVTSGCLLLAKCRDELLHLQEQSKIDTMKKVYQLLVQGHWPKALVRVEKSLSKKTISNERMVVVDEDGKAAATRFSCMESFHKASLLEASLETGRTHQIRVHVASEGHPIAGDKKYGCASFNRYCKEFGLQRIFLHACRLKFSTKDGQALDIVAPLSDALEEVLQALREQNE